MTEKQPVAVLGGGSFGTAASNLLAENGHRVLQWMRDPEQARAMREQRENPRYLKGIKVHPGVEPVTDLLATLAAAELIFVALPSSALRAVLADHEALLAGKMMVSLTKGIEAQTFKLMSEILEEIAPVPVSACSVGRTWPAKWPSTRSPPPSSPAAMNSSASRSRRHCMVPPFACMPVPTASAWSWAAR